MMPVLSASISALLLIGVGALRPEQTGDSSESSELLEQPWESEPIAWNAARGGADGVKCGANMTVSITVPWREMLSPVHGSKSEEECKSCGESVQRRGILKSGWECRRAMVGGWSIHRPGDTSIRRGHPAPYMYNLTEIDEQRLHLPIPIGTKPLPAALQGVFWLTAQGSSSAMMTFGGTNPASSEPKDCEWCSTGDLEANAYRVMPGGDCVWAYATPNSGYHIANRMRLVYDFVFDDREAPTSASIGVNARTGPGAWFNWGQWVADQKWFMHFDMTKETPERAAELGFPGSVVWHRESRVLGFSITPYDLVQIVDGEGRRIEPAWSMFVQYQQSDVAGDSPGTLYIQGDCK